MVVRTIKKNTRVAKSKPRTLNLYNLTKLTDIGCMNAAELNWVQDRVIFRRSEIRETAKPRKLNEWNIFVKNFVMPKTYEGNRLKYISNEWKKIRPYWLSVCLDGRIEKFRVYPDDTFETVFKGAHVTQSGFELSGKIGPEENLNPALIEVVTKMVHFEGHKFPFQNSVSESLNLPEEDLYVVENSNHFEVAARYFDACVWENDTTKVYRSLLPSYTISRIGPVMYNGQVLDPNKSFFDYGITGLVNQMFTRI